MHIDDDGALTAVVIAGAGARGAYEAGALSVLLPKLFPNGLGSAILLGTSAGAINAALWASRAKKGVSMTDIAADVNWVWQQIGRDDVFRVPALEYGKAGFFGAVDAGRTVVDVARDAAENTVASFLSFIPRIGPIPSPAEVVRGIGGVARNATNAAFGAVDILDGHLLRSGAILDTSPLGRTARNYVNFDDLRVNIDEGRVGGIGVVATSCPMDASGGRSRVFLHAPRHVIPREDRGSSIDYVAMPGIRAQHVLASAAIPIAFPPVRVETPEGVAGFYTDGGVRLNAPIEPAIKLGARRIIVVSSHATAYPRPSRKAGRAASPPQLLDIAAQAIHAVLADGMIEDLRLLRRINKMVREAGANKLSSESQRVYKIVQQIEVAPKNGTLSPLAAEVADGLTDAVDVGLLRYLRRLGGASGRNELLSYLLFHPEYATRQIVRGQRRARAALRKGWCV